MGEWGKAIGGSQSVVSRWFGEVQVRLALWPSSSSLRKEWEKKKKSKHQKRKAKGKSKKSQLKLRLNACRRSLTSIINQVAYSISLFLFLLAFRLAPPHFHFISNVRRHFRRKTQPKTKSIRHIHVLVQSRFLLRSHPRSMCRSCLRQRPVPPMARKVV